MDPKNHQFYFERANLKEKRKEFFDAIRDYNKAIELDKKNSEYFNRRALTKLKISPRVYSHSAIRDFTKAINYSPREPSYWQNRACTKSNYLDHNFPHGFNIDSKIGMLLTFKFKRKPARELALLRKQKARELALLREQKAKELFKKQKLKHQLKTDSFTAYDDYDPRYEIRESPRNHSLVPLRKDHNDRGLITFLGSIGDFVKDIGYEILYPTYAGPYRRITDYTNCDQKITHNSEPSDYTESDANDRLKILPNGKYERINPSRQSKKQKIGFMNTHIFSDSR